MGRPFRTRACRSIRRLPRKEADTFFLELSSRDELELLLALPLRERRIWLRLLAPDDAADVIQLAPEDQRASLLNLLDDMARREVNALLAYQEDEAGGLMSPRFARLRPEMTVDEAIRYLRRQAAQIETVYYAYVLDDSQRLLGVLNFRDLFAADGNTLVRELMRTDFVSATDEMDQEAVARLFSMHRLLAIPVLDSQGRMQGIVTADDIVDVVHEEATEDIQKFGGMEALDGPYLEMASGRWSQTRWVAGHPVPWRNVDGHRDGDFAQRLPALWCWRYSSPLSSAAAATRFTGDYAGDSRHGGRRSSAARLVADYWSRITYRLRAGESAGVIGGARILFGTLSRYLWRRTTRWSRSPLGGA